MTAAVAEEAWSSKIPIAFAPPCLLLLAMALVLLLLLLLDMLPPIRQISFRRAMGLALLVLLLLLLLTRDTSRLRSDDPITTPPTLPRQLSPASRM